MQVSTESDATAETAVGAVFSISIYNTIRMLSTHELLMLTSSARV